MKEDWPKRAPLLLCGLLCTLLLPGCSEMMQTPADETDAVLGGLAEGADQVTDALADGCSPRRRGRRDG